MARKLVKLTPENKSVRHSEEPDKLAAVRRAIELGDASGVAYGDVFARIREKLRLSASDGKPLIS